MMKFKGKECNVTEDILKGWEEYFLDLYKPLSKPEFNAAFKANIEAKLKDYQRCNNSVFCDYLDIPISFEEICSACKSLKLNSLGGIDTLTNENLKYGGPTLYEHLSCLFTCMLTKGRTPPAMKKGLVITLLKPGKKIKSNPDNYRGITLLPVIYKLYEKVTLARITCHLRTLENPCPDPLQGAYQKGLSSINTTFGLTETVKYNLERKSKVFVCCLDSMKAFDVVWHHGLFVCLYEHGIRGHLWNSILQSYRDMYNVVIYKGFMSNPIPVLQSTRQGSFWGGWFYLMYINKLIKKLKDLDIGAHIQDLFIGAFFHADDIAFVAINKHCLQLMINECYMYACD